MHGRADQHGAQRERAGQLELRRHVGRDHDREDVVGDVLGEPGAHRRQHLARVAAQHGRGSASCRRRLAVRVGARPALNTGDSSTESRIHSPISTSTAESRNGIRQPQARNASSLCTTRHHGEQAVGDQLPGGRARLRPARPEAAPGRVAVLGDDQHRAAPLAAEREALDQPQQHQQQRGEPRPIGRVGGQQADRERREAHHQQAEHEQLLAADAVAVVAEDQAADGPGEEADRERAQRRAAWRPWRCRSGRRRAGRRARRRRRRGRSRTTRRWCPPCWRRPRARCSCAVVCGGTRVSSVGVIGRSSRRRRTGTSR